MLNGINSKTTAGIADAIATSLNGQELTKTQRERLRSALGSPAVQSVISDMQKTLTSRSDNVSQKPTARNVGQLYTTVQTANNQAKTTVDQEDVAKSLKGKGILSQKIDTLAEAIVARVNGQQLTKTQQSILSFELGRPVVQNVISKLIQKKSNGIDSTQHNAYDKGNIVDGRENSEESAPRGIAKQSVDVNTKLEYDTDADQAEYEKYRSILRENAPETYEGFQTLKYGHPEKWDNLQRKYRIVDRYEVRGNVKIDTILRLDDAAWQTKQTGFSAENLTAGQGTVRDH